MDPTRLSLPQAGDNLANRFLNDALRKELAGNILNTTGHFIERLLPQERLPFPVNEDLLRRLSSSIGANPPIWNDHRSCFLQSPMIHLEEPAVCQWLNNIGMTMGLVYGRQCRRLWWTGWSKVPIANGPIQKKLDLVLLDREHYNSPSQQGWGFVKAVAEVHRSNEQSTVTESIGARSYLTFLSQPHRRFTISLSFFNINNGQFSVTVTDRAGQIRLNQIDLMNPSEENGLLLLSILAFLMFGNPEDIGLDPHYEINASGWVDAIECENRRFQVRKRIHALPSLFGRGTQVWIVTHEGIQYILKDSWAREDRIYNEVAHLRRMLPHKELEGRVPTLICGGDVVINGFKDSTKRYRSASCLHIIHRRIVTSPVGEPVTSFKSKKELIRVMANIIETHRYLHDRIGILHGDLSPGNILVNRKDDGSVVGLLIDYDYSVGTLDLEAVNHRDQDPPHAITPAGAPNAADKPAAEFIVDNPKAQCGPTPRSRTGTPPYMAIEALLAQNFVHKPQHDLESILYVMLTMCTFWLRPGIQYKPDRTKPSFPTIRTWFEGNYSIQDAAYLKLAHLECHDFAILRDFAPYWHDFAPFAKELITACFPVRVRLPNELRYEKALKILKAAYDSVQEPSDPIWTGQVSRLLLASKDTSPQCSTRKRSNSHSLERDSKKGKIV